MKRLAVLGSITGLGLLAVTTAQAQQDMSDVQITAQSVAPGIAVLFGNGGNIGVSYGGDGTLLVDDQFAELVPKIQAAIADLGASPARFLVNTHWHFDHAGGNTPFGRAGTTIVAQDNVRKRLVEGGTVLGQEFPPEPEEGRPVITYDSGMTFHLNDETIDVMHFGGGHTDGDSVVYWRDANVIHMGDMFMHQAGYPFIDIDSGGNVFHLLNSLASVLAMTDENTVVIPGHGPIATRSDLMAFRTMVSEAVDRIGALHDEGLDLDQAIARQPLAGLRNAPGFISDDDFMRAVWASMDAHNR